MRASPREAPKFRNYYPIQSCNRRREHQWSKWKLEPVSGREDRKPDVTRSIQRHRSNPGIRRLRIPSPRVATTEEAKESARTGRQRRGGAKYQIETARFDRKRIEGQRGGTRNDFAIERKARARRGPPAKRGEKTDRRRELAVERSALGAFYSRRGGGRGDAGRNRPGSSGFLTGHGCVVALAW